jgi:hypothetical protein
MAKAASSEYTVDRSDRSFVHSERSTRSWVTGAISTGWGPAITVEAVTG